MLSVVRPMAMAKNNNRTRRQKAVRERGAELKDIRGTLSEISKKERTRMDGLLDLHREFIRRKEEEDDKSENKMVEPEIVPDASIDGYFEGQDN